MMLKEEEEEREKRVCILLCRNFIHWRFVLLYLMFTCVYMYIIDSLHCLLVFSLWCARTLFSSLHALFLSSFSLGLLACRCFLFHRVFPHVCLFYSCHIYTYAISECSFATFLSNAPRLLFGLLLCSDLLLLCLSFCSQFTWKCFLEF